MNLKPGIGAGKKARWEKSQSHRDFFCGSHVWSSWKMLLGRCHWSWSPCFNTGRSCDPFNILAHQVYSIQTVHFLLSNNTDFAFIYFFLIVLKWRSLWFHSPCSWMVHRQKPSRHFTRKQSPGTTVALVSDWIPINLALFISVWTQQSGWKPGCADRRVDYLGWWIWSCTALHLDLKSVHHNGTD